jgi:hypothetical protein
MHMSKPKKKGNLSMSEKERMAQTAEKVAKLMHTDFTLHASECQMKKHRIFHVYADHSQFTYTMESVISFRQLAECGHAFNKAEILLLPEELLAFSFTLKEHDIPLPSNCQQKMMATSTLISYSLETNEPPEYFAERLSAAFKKIEPLENRSISLY